MFFVCFLFFFLFVFCFVFGFLYFVFEFCFCFVLFIWLFVCFFVCCVFLRGPTNGARDKRGFLQYYKGRVMGPLLRSCLPLFQEKCNCHVQNCVFFLCGLDNFRLKIVFFFLFWKSNFKKALIWKRAILTYFWHFLVIRGNTQNFLQHRSHTYTCFAHPIFFALQIWQKLRIYHIWFLFGATPGVDSYSSHSGTMNR